MIGIAALSILLLLTIAGVTVISPTYARTVTLNISPNPALPNQAVTFAGQVSRIHNLVSDNILLVVYNGAGCSGTGSNELFTTVTTAAGSYIFHVTVGFSSGSYSVRATDLSYSPNVLSPCVQPNVLSGCIVSVGYVIAQTSHTEKSNANTYGL